MNRSTTYIAIPERPGFIRRCIGLGLFLSILGFACSGMWLMGLHYMTQLCSYLLGG